MNAPFFKFGLFGDNASLLVAFLIGIGFGFFLERAGFGSGKKLAAQFYFRDLAVFKVMFTAIVTAMLGVFWCSRLGFLDLSQVYLVPTHLTPQLVGGVLLGIGFVIGGYCPGTSVVAAATGRLDAWVYMGGMFAGMLAVSFVMPELGGFMALGDRGQTTLAALWNVPYGVLVIAVVLIAVGGFVGAEWLEVKFGGVARSSQPLLGAVGLGGSRRLMLGFAALGLTAALAGSPYVGSTATFNTDELTLDVVRANDHLTAEQLADRLIAAVDVPRIVDLRDPQAFARSHLPGATNVPMAGLGREPWRADETVLLYSGADPHAEQAWMLLKARKFPRVYTLQGGIEAWNEQVLFPRVSETDSNEARRKIAVAHAFGGTPRTNGAAPAALEAAPMPVAPPPVVVPAAADNAPKKKKKEGC